MVQLTVDGNVAILEVQGLDKLWSFTSRLEIPIAHIHGVSADPQAARGWWHGIRAPGTNLLGVITAGTFYQHGKRVFWDVHDPDQTIVIELADERYDQLIVEVADPAAAVRLLQARIGEQSG